MKIRGTDFVMYQVSDLPEEVKAELPGNIPAGGRVFTSDGELGRCDRFVMSEQAHPT